LSDDLSADKQHQLRVLLETLKDDEWLSYVLHWRNSSDVLLEELDASFTVKKQTEAAAEFDQAAEPGLALISTKAASESAQTVGV
ncbi:MAG: hypothetical protein ND895_27735, partial [Pyrinomonadaceae bacterium]|nr:hypothetical protein [Pyrinomonadaceae bacterium]